MPEKTFFGYSAFSVIVSLAATFTQQDLLAWTAALSAVVLAFLPVYRRVMDEIHKSETAYREIRRKDCLEILKRQKELNAELLERIKTLERESCEWKRLYEAGSGHYKNMG